MARGVEAGRAWLRFYDHYEEKMRLNAAVGFFGKWVPD